MKTTLRHWAVVLPNITKSVNLLSIHIQGSLYKYLEIKPPCTTCTQRANLFAAKILCGDKRGGVHVCALACEWHRYTKYGLN